MTNSRELEDLLRRSFADRKLTRDERDEFERLFHASVPDANLRDRILAFAFALFRDELSEQEDREGSEWLKRVVRATLPKYEPPASTGEANVAEACFSERHDCARRLVRMLDDARQSLDVCVFTITHDDLSGAILRAASRGVAVRLISDDSKATDTGSDVDRLRDAGVAVRVDRSPYHMHHKFAIFDRRLLLNGSFNWTRGAAMNNAENFVLLSDRRLVDQFQDEFELLWEAWK
ncbi:MAG TPA: phospholipase D-like domain-containing protein [Pirellulaceae bacterium]|jgi:phosphatidylserine/phosphatidylglycerophosphate/cardiolipin synthase-like enzyme|nr:phospholipase D-like domain-containing protein [Pirellulaceae bacterium]